MSSSTGHRTAIALALTAAFAGTACSGSARGVPAEEAPSVPAGTRLTFVIDETLSTDDAEAGQSFEAHVASPVTASDGTVVVPAGAAARGTVVESTESSGSESEAVLAVRIETVDLNGAPVPVEGSVVSADVNASADDTGAETAGKIAIGAAAGAIIGQIIGRDTESTLAGAGAGAVAGTVIALTTRGGTATLPRGSTIVVQLDEPLSSN